MDTSWEKVLKKNSGIKAAKEGLKQIADIEHSALLHLYFNWMGFIGISRQVAHQIQVGMQRSALC